LVAPSYSSLVILAGAVLVLLLAATVIVCSTPLRVAWLLGVAALAALWLVINRPLEGPILWVAAPGYGLTAADLISPVCLAAAAVGFWVRRATALPRPEK